MIEKKYDVYFDEEKIGSDMRIDDALIFVKALSDVYTPQMAAIGSRISIKLTEETVKTFNDINNEPKGGEE